MTRNESEGTLREAPGVEGEMKKWSGRVMVPAAKGETVT